MAIYGTIKGGRLNACFYARDAETDYAACYALFNQEPVGDKYDLPMQAAVVNNRPCIVYEGKVLGYLPIDWTSFLTEVVSRGPIQGIGSIQWTTPENYFRVRLDIDEN